MAPIYIGPANAEHVIGQPWRWTRDTARRLGVSILKVGGKPLIRAAELAAALEREAALGAPSPALDARAELARRLG